VLAEVGEARFRELESEALKAVLDRAGPMVLATGGGVVEGQAARGLLARRTTCVWLQVASGELERRMRADPTPRPGLTGQDPVAEIATVLERREPLYAEVAEVRIDCRGLGIAEVARETARRIGNGGRSGCRG
jgi:shikimate kinase